MTPSDYSMTRLLDELILPSAVAIAALSFCVHAGVAAQQLRPGQTEKRPDVPSSRQRLSL